ncbi:MAG TPA: hypothetical protein P5555_02400, partial [Candidatus Paceibacterota bacterium]|nr:hypothetical protein [Verrucomicrobiota bacterium]HRZ44024.1 hypothetical protein [Candidatus Paceibacterota bacterium]
MLDHLTMTRHDFKPFFLAPGGGRSATRFDTGSGWPAGQTARAARPLGSVQKLIPILLEGIGR